MARALGETIAVFLVIGRADGRLPAPADAVGALVHPGQTLSTKLGGPEPVLAGGAGAHHAALSALRLLLFALIAAITVAGLYRSKRTDRRVGHRHLRSRPRGRRIRALGLDRAQLSRSVLVPWATPGLLTGTLLGLARAAGETAPLLFAATVFAGASGLPAGITDTPVVALPTHVFTLAQDAADPVALDAAWGAALVLVLLAALLLLAAIPARRRMEAHQ